MDIGVNALSTIVATWIDNEAVVRMYVSRFVHCVVTRPEAPGRISPIVPAVAVRVVVVGTWGKVEVHQVGYRGLTLLIERTHVERLDNGILINLYEAFRALVLLLALLVVPWRG